MCESLRDFLNPENIVDIEDVYNAALPFLASEYERFRVNAYEYLPLDPLHQVHFILAGYSARAAKNLSSNSMIFATKVLVIITNFDIKIHFMVSIATGKFLISIRIHSAKIKS
jgi:hypothetical protein